MATHQAIGDPARRDPADATRGRTRIALILWALLAVGMAVSVGGCGKVRRDLRPPPAKPSVLLIGIDTMRADHLGVAGNDSLSTPHLDALVHDGVLFTRALATAPWTLPSFASVFTGLLPYRHGAVGGERSWLADRHTTLAERFVAAGYRTGGFVSIDWLTRVCNMEQGFQPWQGPLPPPGMSRAENQTWLARSFFDWHRMRPFFLFLHYFDVHTPYTPPPPFDGMYYLGDPYRPGEPVLTLLRSPANRAPNRDSGMYDFLDGVTDLAYPIKQYAAGVSYVDMHVGQVLARLKMLDLYDEMLIIVLSDHGEHLGEHDIWFTHWLPYEETLRVPLIIKLPGNRHAGQVVTTPVSLLDVLPTIIAETGMREAADLDGRDLRPIMAGRDRGHSLLAAEQGSDVESYSKSLQEGDWKLLFFREPHAGRYELYDLAHDPHERADRAAEQPVIVERLRDKMWRLWDPQRIVADDGQVRPRTFDEGTRRRLRSLGY